ncbi:MAG: DUF72 domain-containing protein [Candidatus Zixiibacteriota bacterium]|nr:MAG: DUF72 domain-containing protein [candidate division Zixibacteria bacterium]
MDKKGGFFIGTSGWNYTGWRGVFYPEKIKSKDFLSFYADHFSTVEVNYSFYRLPEESTYEKWVALTPDDFTFVLKLSRFITHIKRLKDVGDALETFIERSETLGAKRGPLLVQLPPSFSFKDVNRNRVRDFLRAVQRLGASAAVEFRHETWFVDTVYDLLSGFDAPLVVANSSRYPNPPEDIATADFVYFRFHGPEELFASPYSDKQLAHYADIMKKHARQGKDVYAYFNNDFGGFAAANALTLKRMVGKKRR